MKRKPKVLAVCTMGLNRSKYLASYLRNKGYRTKYGGIGDGKIPKLILRNPFNQEDVDWADVIIVVRKKHKPLLKEHYNIKGKKIIVFDVTGSLGVLIKKFPEIINKNPSLKKMDRVEFNKKWTYPQLRKAIKPYLPLK
jgi:hypothetical protein